MHELKEISSGETSNIYFDDKYFYRLLNIDCADFFLNVFATLKPKISDKLVKTALFEGSLPLPKQPHQAILVHDKINYISYPHEWCALMLKDAALFHLDLQRELLENDLYLKDAHPWNLLFNEGKFAFVDIPSVVNDKRLFESNTALSNDPSFLNNPWHYFSHIMQTMFLPYFFQPLCGYAFGKREWIKMRIESTTLNAATDKVTFRNCLPPKKYSLKNIFNLFKLISKMVEFHKIIPKNKTQDIKSSLTQLYSLVESLAVTKENSAYKSYYQQKNELSEYNINDSWNEKQKSLYQILCNDKMKTVLDIACNTGWYSILAAKQGKKVVALDIDESCIEELYTQVKQHAYNILPLQCSINNITKDRYSIETGKRIIINLAERMSCDVVLALGILHHLILGQGISFDEIFILLKQFVNHQLVVEFIEKEDEKISSEPEFFLSFNQDPEKYEFYNLSNFLKTSEKYFNSYQILPSFPKTRKIIIFENLN